MARDDYDDRDRDDRDRDDDRPDDRERDYDADDIRVASKKVKPPAICLLIAGILSVLSIGWGVYQYINFDKEFDAQIEKSQKQQPNSTPQQQQAVKEMTDTIRNITKVAMPIGLGLQTLTALVMIFGSTRVLSLSSRGWGTAAAAMALIPHLTCLIWCLSLAFGIWMLVTLGNKDVRRGFEAKQRERAGGGGDSDRRDDDDRDDRR